MAHARQYLEWQREAGKEVGSEDFEEDNLRMLGKQLKTMTGRKAMRRSAEAARKAQRRSRGSRAAGDRSSASRSGLWTLSSSSRAGSTRWSSWSTCNAPWLTSSARSPWAAELRIARPTLARPHRSLT